MLRAVPYKTIPMAPGQTRWWVCVNSECDDFDTLYKAENPAACPACGESIRLIGPVEWSERCVPERASA